MNKKKKIIKILTDIEKLGVWEYAGGYKYILENSINNIDEFITIIEEQLNYILKKYKNTKYEKEIEKQKEIIKIIKEKEESEYIEEIKQITI